jgi:ribosomal protein S27E
MADQDVIEGTKTTDQIPEDKITKMTADKPQEDEVGGRAMQLRLARCGSCGNTGYIYYDTVNYRAYQCNRCGSVMIF